MRLTPPNKYCAPPACCDYSKHGI